MQHTEVGCQTGVAHSKRKKSIELATVCQFFKHGRTKAVVVERRSIPEKAKQKKEPKAKTKKQLVTRKMQGRIGKREKRRRNANPSSTPKRRYIAPEGRPLEKMGSISISNYERLGPASSRYLQSAGMPGNEEADI
ncbi:hypothetical protein GCM10008942_05660 [Rhizomicrobium electricum]|uniref:Uncharacterized protein n=2 Tax=Rhizomicrobium electricum TaxID=480070 RepID=A0ABN1E6B7_9PROT